MRDFHGNSSINFKEVAGELYRVLKKGGVVVWVINDQTKKGDESGTSFRHALGFKEIGFRLFDTMIYLKRPRGAVGNIKGYWQTFEYMFVLSKGEPKTINLLMDRENKEESGRITGTRRLKNGELVPQTRKGYGKYGRRTNVWLYNIGGGHSYSDIYAKGHPATFPEQLAKDHILSWSNKGDLVYDPYMGGGTTAKMCVSSDRNFIGSEIVEDYCEVAKKRIAVARNERAIRLIEA